MEEGGLGIRRLRDSSKVFSLRLLWRLISGSSSLWVAWTKAHLLKHGFFGTKFSYTSGSWIWRKLLKLRGEVADFLKWEIHDGKSVSFWWDNWLDTGPLLPLVGDSGPVALGVARYSVVAAATRGSQWRIRRCRGVTLCTIWNSLQAVPVPSPDKGPDTPLWRYAKDIYKPFFSSRHTWNQTRPVKEKVPWYRTVWFPQRVPRYSFIVWLAIKDRLSTGTRMRAWGANQPCIFCGERDESRDHLFFACPYTFTIWSDLAGKLLGRKLNPDWSRTLTSLRSPQFTLLDKTLLRIAFQTALYMIWRERNGRIHTRKHNAPTTLLRLMDKAIWDRIISLRTPATATLGDLLHRWGNTRA